jgi:hypothetical protein
VFCYRNAAGAATRVSGTSGGVAEALAARIMSFNDGGLLDFLGPVAVKGLYCVKLRTVDIHKWL